MKGSSISPRTVRRILSSVDLKPHRTRYWRSTKADSRFKERAEKVLWCYANAPRLAREGFWVVSTDEMPNRQVLERRPIRRAVPGYIERQEFEYVRHGTANILTFLLVHSGLMAAVCLEANDAAHYIPALERFRREHERRDGIRGYSSYTTEGRAIRQAPPRSTSPNAMAGGGPASRRRMRLG